MRTRQLNNRIEVLRRERGMTRKQLAEKLEVNVQTVGYLERGEYNPSLDLAFRVSDCFGLPVEMIFSPDPMKPLSEELYQRKRKEGD
jgi:putative transcriptional regulator